MKTKKDIEREIKETTKEIESCESILYNNDLTPTEHKNYYYDINNLCSRVNALRWVLSKNK